MRQRSIKCYGGPKHGEYITTDRDRFDVMVPPQRNVCLRWDEPMYMDLSFHTVTYTVELFRELRGNWLREMEIAVIDGAMNITNSDKWEIESDIRKYHWRPYLEPNFLKDFDDWFAWCAYRNDHYNSQHLFEEFRRI